MLINQALLTVGAARLRSAVVVRVSNRRGVPRDGGGPVYI